MINCNFIASRITELRMKKGISEQKMSFELGHSGNYIQLISSGKMTPSLKELFSICEFLEVSPALFFDENLENPPLIQSAMDAIKKIPEKDLMLLVPLLQRFISDNQ